MERTKKNKPCGHSWKRRLVPQTRACLWQLGPYLIATSGEKAALFVSDCMLWLLSGGSAQFWGSACQLGHSPVCSVTEANRRTRRQRCRRQSCYYQQASSDLDNNNKTSSAKIRLVQPFEEWARCTSVGFRAACIVNNPKWKWLKSSESHVTHLKRYLYSLL